MQTLMQPPEKGHLLTTEEAAEYLGYSVDTLRRLARQRKVRYIRYSARNFRFRIPDLDQFLKSREVAPI